MQTILGSGGAIGLVLARALKTYTSDIRLVSRNPSKVNDTDQLFSADLTNRDQVFDAVKGSSVVYLTVGFTYSIKVWKEVWPKVMRNVIDACKEYNAKLVFFDNIYMYDPNFLNDMTEETPINPSSEKGKIRAEIANMLMNEVKSGSLTALIARSADFYGPSIRTSMLTETVIKNLSKGSAAFWLGGLNFKHSFTYTPDAAKATALLGNTPDAFNQVWHLPTATNPPTGKAWVELFAKELGATPKVKAFPKWMVKLMGIFIPIMKEMIEMFYQYDRDYVFNSSKFEERFNTKATSYEEGIKEIVSKDYRK